MTVATKQAPKLNPSLEHFLDCAYRGRHAGSSGGEKQCREIARCLLENVPGLDGANIAGIQQVLNYITSNPEVVRRIIDLRD